jgi:hypothetical protein
MASFFAVLAFSVQAQEADLLSEMPQTKEQCIAGEKNVLTTIYWLENTPVKTDEENTGSSTPC